MKIFLLLLNLSFVTTIFAQNKILDHNKFIVPIIDILALEKLQIGNTKKLQLNDSTFITVKINMHVQHSHNLINIGASIAEYNDAFLNITLHLVNDSTIIEGLLFFKEAKTGFKVLNTTNNKVKFEQQEAGKFIIND